VAWRLQTFTALSLNTGLDRNQTFGKTARRERRKRFLPRDNFDSPNEKD